MSNWEIHIEGQVQGVGFRPTVAKVACEMEISGEVCNTSSGVLIRLYCTAEVKDNFLQHLSEKLPPLAVIASMCVEELPFSQNEYDGFHIVSSSGGSNKQVFLSPDFGICQACQHEILDPEDFRYHYPFISCTQCGPRYSILEGTPYDRQLSSMGEFDMCADCISEYENPKDRRFHSQTNSCTNCGIQLTLYPDQTDNDNHLFDLVKSAVDIVNEGKILAVKATTGFLLVADATNPAAVSLLRERKKRPKKPLALMVADGDELAKYFIVNDHILREITSSARPILLCKPKKGTALRSSDELIAPGLSAFGVCLPADPLMFLISKQLAKPVIATSGNLHQSPLQFENQAALENLYGVADSVLYHNRVIHFPQDDSVCRLTEDYGRKIILRRSRGLSPTFWNKANLNTDVPVLGLGADLKSTFSLWNNFNVYVSQYLGNLESYDTQERFLELLKKFLSLTGIQPMILLLDRHPQYDSRNFPLYYPNADVIEVPHHEAHFAALLWENASLDSDEPILGVIWDGLGFGDDGAIWGGEFFVYKDGEFDRCFAFDYFNYLLGDKMSKEPRIAALSLCSQAGEYPEYLKKKFSPHEWSLYTKLLSNEKRLNSSSMGRVFDAVASVLGLCDINSFEGEAAMLLENVAQDYLDLKVDGLQKPYDFEIAVNGKISYAPIILQVLKDREEGVESGLIALRFHRTLVGIIAEVAGKSSCQTVGFSGGVFQNGLLVDLLIRELGASYRLLFHEQLSPNDENISLGQMAWYYIKNNYSLIKTKNHVFGDSR